MKYLLPLLFLVSNAFAQREAFTYDYTNPISVTDSFKVKDEWHSITATGKIHVSGIADCKYSDLLDNKIELKFDSIYTTSQKSLPSLSLASFDVSANLQGGVNKYFHSSYTAGLQASIGIVFFTDFSIIVSSSVVYEEKKIGVNLLGGVSKVLYRIK